MFEAIKKVFRGEGTPTEQTEQENQENQRTPMEPTTVEEALSAELERLRSSIERDDEQYKQYLSMLEEAGQKPPDQTGQQQMQAPQQPTAESGEDITSRIIKRIGDEPTLEDFVRTIVEEVTAAVNRQVSTASSAVRPQPYLGDAYAELVVNRVLKKYPYLSTVMDDGLRLLQRMPAEQLNEEVADWVLHALKGRRSEAEKKEALANLFDYDTVEGSSAPNIQELPQEKELTEFAENMGINPDRLKKRLVETLRSNNRR